MQIRHKILAFTLPAALIAVATLAFYQYLQITQTSRAAYQAFMESAAASFLEHEIRDRHRILQESNLLEYPEYVNRYLEQMAASARERSSWSRNSFLLFHQGQLLTAGKNDPTALLASRIPLAKESFGQLDTRGTELPEKFFYVKAFAPLDLHLAVLTPLTFIQAHTATLNYPFILISSLLIIIPIVLVYFFIKKIIVKRIQHLGEHARRIANSDFDTPIQARGEDEIDKLLTHMESMRCNLQASYTEIRNFNRSLQQEVEKQTRELQLRSQELETSNQELEQFAYVASHDLQEPLRMVSSFLSLLERKYKGQLDDKADTYIHYAVDGAQRLQKMIQDLLMLSRITTRGAPLAAVSLARTLEPALSNLQVSIRESSASINNSIPAELEVLGDASQLVQLFQNLISNALKYSGEKPAEVLIGTQTLAETGRIRVEVADRGPGIDEAYFDKAFLIFHRLNQDPDKTGSGIGLALCRKIVERHGGTIELANRRDGGLLVSFTLQMQDENVQPQDENAS